MYEELVNTLLYDAGWLEQGMTQTERDIAEHLKKAADAIEELSAFADTVKRLNAEGWFMQRHKADTCGYCIETRPLPDPPKEGDMNT